MSETEGSELKRKTAGTLKWNTIDRVATQVVYALVGVVLANLLSKEDFGLVGAILVFQSFAILFVDSGFGAALLQRKEPDEEDYSTVFWFNLMVASGIYVILFFCAPLIADIFQGDRRLIGMSRVMFLTFVLNGLGIVQTNRLMKQMRVRMIAVSNVVALVVSGGLGVGLALGGFGAWALVWQSVALAAIKTAWLWIGTGWRPKLVFSKVSMQRVWRVGLGVFSGSFLNTLFLNIYSFVIGAWYSLASLGVYTQADKWSKMGTASLSQIFTASFVPLLSKVQDSPDDYRRYMGRINRFSAFLVFPAMMGLALIATPLFHTLFSDKWDTAIPLFQILCLRGVFVVQVSLFGNYLLARGYAKSLVIVEVVKDVLTLGAILATVWMGSVEALVWGQFAASGVAWVYVMWHTSRSTGYGVLRFLADNAPYFFLCLVTVPVAWLAGEWVSGVPVLDMLVRCLVALAIYCGVLHLSGSRTYKEALAFLLHRRTAVA